MRDDSAQLLDCLPRLRRYARALLGDRSEADDLVQDTVERAWKRLSSWRQGSDMRPWLFSIMHNLHVDRLRRPAPELVALSEDLVQSTPSTGTLELRELDAALPLLPPEQREVLLLVALEEMTYEEVAATLGIPPGTVMSRLSRARERLRLLMLGHPVPVPLKVVK
ncbi:RNA polymerase sigma factor [Massilia endophytica]|uniref:RNA polymerase sigma factor n=1 Tax=Massilia endophytica TaxID=2899220 RepID=UPI001E5ADDF2|nr:RNA polymerase sigma factor [Massilia endophytica]UGQ46858.1 RNA polymerase sigma factor [Massilia endophytica]